jgi:thiosulfate/3-mercaptopyruvate sulfurtransferase
MDAYANPDMLVSTDWVVAHLNDPNVAIVEVDVDTGAYDEGHVPGAIGWNWQTQLCDTVQRDILNANELQKLLSESGINNNTTIVLYGDNNNWFAAWALWQLKMYGHNDVRLMNGGRKKWLAEGREVSLEKPNRTPSAYTVSEPNMTFRAFQPDVMDALKATDRVALVDVRSNDEFTGKVLSPPGLPETCQRGGHIPGAYNVPWAQACNEDGTFKSASELSNLYGSKGLTPDKDVIAYCRIGERSSHTWFALKYLLGFENVRNYDGSWTEWGNMVGAPVEKGETTL